MELNPDPQSTWGASEEYKQEWNAKYGEDTPKDVEAEQQKAQENTQPEPQAVTQKDSEPGAGADSGTPTASTAPPASGTYTSGSSTPRK